MRWKKLGKIFELQAIDENILTHVANPVAKYLHDDIFRVYFSARDREDRSSLSYVDIDIFTKEISQLPTGTTFKYGDLNNFYSHGVSIGNIYKIQNREFMGFMGWQIQKNTHWRGDIGRVKIEDDEISLTPKEPFISCDKEDKVSLSYPWIMRDNNIYKMWYGSTISWTSSNSEMIHVIKYATSKDGENWQKHGLAIPYKIGVAQAFSRPSIIKNEKGYHMWYSYRSGDGSKYKIGYSHSSDALKWTYTEESTLQKSQKGWDSEMVCYPFVFIHKKSTYMLYNGNEHGKSGFGLAILEDK